ncbi:UNVERIFIED_CONTAM: FHA domain-containing protein, partial [Mycobacterium avium subsp. hominissuis]
MAMSAPAPPALTVHHEGSERTFAAGHDVVVGRDLRADMRITHPLISRAHLLLRYDQGKWLAIDNGSLNGTFVNGRRVPVVEIHDGCAINIGNPDGPLADEISDGQRGAHEHRTDVQQHHDVLRLRGRGSERVGRPQ